MDDVARVQEVAAVKGGNMTPAVMLQSLAQRRPSRNEMTSTVQS